MRHGLASPARGVFIIIDFDGDGENCKTCDAVRVRVAGVFVYFIGDCEARARDADFWADVKLAWSGSGDESGVEGGWLLRVCVRPRAGVAALDLVGGAILFGDWGKMWYWCRRARGGERAFHARDLKPVLGLGSRPCLG